jgi:HK97 family phage major capsid protein
MATAEFQDVGVWVETQLEMRDEYEKRLMELAAAGKLGWSSGAAGHLVEREQVGKSYHIKSWPIAEASLTPTPAEPRNTVISVKSLFDNIQPAKEPEEDNMTEEVKDKVVQPEIDLDALFAKFEERQKKAIEEAVANAQKAILDALEPETKADVQVVEDAADRALKGNPFKADEFFKAVYNAEVYGHSDDRLNALKATGLNEAIPSQGGFLVPQQIASGIFENMWSVGSVLSQFTAINVAGNNLTIPAIDETTRVDGGRMGGVRGYWMAEAADKTASKPKFRVVDLKLKKVAALVYATDELLADASAMESWIVNNVPNELRFMVEAALIGGDGIGKPLGILSSPALVQAVRTDANEIDSWDIARMWARRYPGAGNYVWFANASIMPQIYQLLVGNVPVYQSGMSGYTNTPSGTIFGRPVIETEYNPALGTVGDLLLAAPSQYAFIAKGGIQAASSIHVKFVQDETAFRFVYRCDGQPIWTSAVTPYKGGAGNSISPFVALAATT